MLTADFYAVYSAMINKLVTYFLSFLFLTGSILLPLGDFSLMQDIPSMYQNYAHITTQEELGITDFIGDYLLHGKEIFGHNEHDKSENSGNRVQFQHQASPLNVVFFKSCFCVINLPGNWIKHLIYRKRSATYEFHDELFRPPLA